MDLKRTCPHKIDPKLIQMFGLFMVVGSCITPLEMSVPPVDYRLVVDGLITNDPGPYTVRLYRERPLKIDLDQFVVEKNATVRLLDDAGNSETLVEVQEGVYESSKNGMRGEVGRSYHLEIETVRGGQFYTEPDQIQPVGRMQSIRYEFVEGPFVDGLKKDAFKIYANAIGVPAHLDFLRFRMVGTYKVRTYPEREEKSIGGGVKIPDPPPCSGYEYREGLLQYVGECTCCYCWITEKNEAPVVFNEVYTGLDMFNDVYVGDIQVTPESFSDLYRVEVEQLGLSSSTFQFWNLVRAQKAGAVDIFQPPIGALNGNVRSRDGSESPLGIFWAAGVSRESIFLSKGNLPYPLRSAFEYEAACTKLDYSSNRKPTFWP
jgi:Domain of unknown function (DUF4249)